MKKAFKIAAFAVLAAFTVITLTSGDMKRGGGYKDMVDELYDQAVKQNNDLETIEEDIENFAKKKQEAIEKYNAYSGYHSRYYRDAKANAVTIGDPATKQKANEIIAASEAKYKTKITDWQATIAALNASESELGDLHTLLKIKISEAIIEKAQNSGLPDSGKAKEANGDIRKIVEKIKVITK
jgi:hypothetical protein